MLASPAAVSRREGPEMTRGKQGWATHYRRLIGALQTLDIVLIGVELQRFVAVYAHVSEFVMILVRGVVRSRKDKPGRR